MTSNSVLSEPEIGVDCLAERGITRAIPALAPSGPSCGRSNSFQTNLSNRVLINPHYQPDIKRPQAGAFYVWRRERDSNPRYAINVYSLSRGAPSAARPSLQFFHYSLSRGARCSGAIICPPCRGHMFRWLELIKRRDLPLHVLPLAD